MSDIAAPDEGIQKSPKSRLLLLSLPLIAALGGFAASYLGYVNPSDWLALGTHKASPELQVAYVEVPRIVVPLSGRAHRVALNLKIETSLEHSDMVQKLMPRFLDSFNGFLTDVDPAAFDRRGVLEIVRNELQSRAKILAGPGVVEGVFITGFSVK